jgi:hypothetical protein
VDLDIVFEFLQQASPGRGMAYNSRQPRFEVTIYDQVTLHAGVGGFQFVDQLTECIGKHAYLFHATCILA